MHFRLIILLAALLGLYLLINWFLRTPPKKLARMLKKAALYGGILFLVLLVATGRLHWLFAAIGAAIPFMQRLFTLLRLIPLFRQLKTMLGVQPGSGGASAGSKGQTSTIKTRYLEMNLDHDTGAMSGTVLEGRFMGRTLEELELEQCLELLSECRTGDSQSAAVLEAYLERTYDDEWRHGTESGRENGGSQSVPLTGDMTRDEAFAVLGLDANADDKDVRDAHRRLMQKLHPDRGGSDYLAAKINQAKDLLLS